MKDTRKSKWAESVNDRTLTFCDEYVALCGKHGVWLTVSQDYALFPTSHLPGWWTGASRTKQEAKVLKGAEKLAKKRAKIELAKEGH